MSKLNQMKFKYNKKMYIQKINKLNLKEKFEIYNKKIIIKKITIIIKK